MKNLLLPLLLCLSCCALGQTYCTPGTLYGAAAASRYITSYDSFTLVGSRGMIHDTIAGTTTGYRNRTSLSCTLYGGASYVVTCVTSASFGQSTQVWIDFNNDGIFDRLETVGGLASYTYTGYLSLRIPPDALPGSHRMRVWNKYTGYGTGWTHYPNILPCATSADTGYQYGEARDYTVSIDSTLPAFVSDSVSVYVMGDCAGLSFMIVPDTVMTATDYVVSYFGDGGRDSSVIDTITRSIGVTHHYASSGTYTIKHILYGAGHVVDTIMYSYHFVGCADAYVSVYLDNDSDCIHTSADDRLSAPVTVAIDSNGRPVDTFVTLGGFYYHEEAPLGTAYTFRVVAAPTGTAVTCPTFADTVGSGTLHPNHDIGIRCTGADLDRVIYNRLRANANDVYGFIHVVSLPQCDPGPVTVALKISPKYAFFRGYPTPSSTTGGIVIWNLSIHGDSNIDYSYRSTSFTLRDTLASLATVSVNSIETDTNNNTVFRIDTVRAANDPNFVEATPEGCLNTSDTTLTYTVGFENDGNDTAHNIFVLDTLSNYLDASTLYPLFASHAMDMEKIVVGGQTIIKFGFPNIMLPDSSHHNQCHGTFSYSIKARPALADGTIIPARVGIYFDDNDVVMTNTWTNRIGCPTPLAVPTPQKLAVHLYPNPTGNQLNIDMESGAFETLTVSNSVGAVVVSKSITGNHVVVPVKELPAGMYYVTLRGAMGVSVQKFVKE